MENAKRPKWTFCVSTRRSEGCAVQECMCVLVWDVRAPCMGIYMIRFLYGDYDDVRMQFEWCVSVCRMPEPQLVAPFKLWSMWALSKMGANMWTERICGTSPKTHSTFKHIIVGCTCHRLLWPNIQSKCFGCVSFFVFCVHRHLCWT